MKRSSFYDEDLVSISKGKSNKQIRESKKLGRLRVDLGGGTRRKKRTTRRDARRETTPLAQDRDRARLRRHR